MKRGRRPAAAPSDEPRPTFRYTNEGGGVVATCNACDWLRWEPTRPAAADAAAGHTRCLKGDVALVGRRRRSEQAQRIYNL